MTGTAMVGDGLRSSMREDSPVSGFSGSAFAGHEDKERVRDAVDIADLIGSYLDLRRQGRNYVALCPWHDDTRPSLQVNTERQSWKCWVCDIGGDIFSFVMKREGIDFPEALNLLADRAGITLTRHGKRSVAGEPHDKQTLYRVMQWAESQFRDCYLGPEGKAARAYVASRGLTDDCAERFSLGYAPGSWQWLIDRARGSDFTETHLANVGLISFSDTSRRHYDRFRDRLMFAIHDIQGRTVGFGGRVLPGGEDQKSAKYINSPDTRLFTKSDHLFGFDKIRDFVAKQRHLVIVEGYTDVMMAWQSGVQNVAAALGTALGQRQIELIKRFADRVTLVLDGDEAGQRRSGEILELFVNNAVDLRIATIPEGLDPCDFIRQRGADTFGQLVADSEDALDFRVRSATQGIDIRQDMHGANIALEEILLTLSRSSQRISSERRLRLTQIISRLGRLFRIDEEELRVRLQTLRFQPQSRSFDKAAKAPALQTELHAWDRELFEVLIKFPSLVADAFTQVKRTDLHTDSARQLFDVYEETLKAGRTPDFETMILVLDERLKSVLVSLDENARRRSQSAEQAAEALQDTVLAFARKRTALDCQTQMEELDSQNMTDGEQLDAFMKLLDLQRERRGLSTPTDG